MNMSIIAAIVIFIAVLLFWLIMSYKGFANLRNSSDEAFRTVESCYKRRRQAAADLVRLLKKHIHQEADVIQNVRDAVQLAEAAEERGERIHCEAVLGETLDTLFETVENYPQLEDSRRYSKLKDQAVTAQRSILETGKIYNTIVKMMNQKAGAIPSCLIAKMFHFTKQPMI